VSRDVVCSSELGNGAGIAVKRLDGLAPARCSRWRDVPLPPADGDSALVCALIDPKDATALGKPYGL